MSEYADRYRRVSADLTAGVEAVPLDKWNSPSPCEGWSARDVLRHVIDTYRMFLGFVGRELPPGPSVDEDPVGAWRSARDAIQAAFDDPEVASTEYEGAFGRSTFEVSADQFISADVVIHSWDLARATGGDERLDPDEMRRIGEALAPMDEAMRSPRAFGPKLDPPEAADEQTRFLAFLGRRAW